MKEETSKNSNEALKFFVVLLVLIFVLFFSREKKKKKDLADYYGITKPTLAKWIAFFPCEAIQNDWKSKRLLSNLEFLALQLHFGRNSKFVLSKNQIAFNAGSNCKTVAANVLRNPLKCGLTKDAWWSLSLFPPKISQRILDHLS